MAWGALLSLDSVNLACRCRTCLCVTSVYLALSTLATRRLVPIIDTRIHGSTRGTGVFRAYKTRAACTVYTYDTYRPRADEGLRRVLSRKSHMQNKTKRQPLKNAESSSNKNIHAEKPPNHSPRQKPTRVLHMFLRGPSFSS